MVCLGGGGESAGKKSTNGEGVTKIADGSMKMKADIPNRQSRHLGYLAVTETSLKAEAKYFLLTVGELLNQAVQLISVLCFDD